MVRRRKIRPRVRIKNRRKVRRRVVLRTVYRGNAPALLTLRRQVDALWPDRSKSNDGFLGDAAHRARKSDHNPNKAGIVQATDITHDPKHGCDSYKLAEMFRINKDKRIKYVISNKKIMSGEGQKNTPWVWRKYTGSNSHSMHVHVSVRDDLKLYNDSAEWSLDMIPGDDSAPEVKEYPVLRRGDNGEDVKTLQQLLGIKEDGDFGGGTERVVKALQKRNKLRADGVVGPYTWGLLK